MTTTHPGQDSPSSPKTEPARRGIPLDDTREMLDHQVEVLELIARATPLPDVLARILAALERLMPGARCSVLLLDRAHGTLHHGAAPSLPATYIAAIDGMRIGDGAGSCGTAAARNSPVVAVDVRTDPRWVDFRHHAAAAGLRSCWSSPIHGRDGMPVGTFAVYHATAHHPTPREELLVGRFTHLASVAIDHAGLLGDLVDSEERFRRPFDGNSLGMAILAADRTITTCNAALERLAGRRGALRGGTLAGLDFAELVTPTTGTLDVHLRPLSTDQAASDPSVVVFEGRLHRTPPTRPRTATAPPTGVEVEVTVSRLRTRRGIPAQLIVNVLDLTERRAAERHRRARLQAETRRRTAEIHSRAKSDLLAALSHEVRTPIQAIVGFAELLGTMELDPTRRLEALGHIGAAAGHVMELLTDVLDLSRLEAGALPLTLAPLTLTDVVAEVLGILSPTAHRRGVDLVDDAHPEVVLADRRRLRQVLLNLVGNAIRHGGGRVVVRSRPSDDPAYAVLSVDDDGPGIPPEVLPVIFTAYARHTPADPGSSTGSSPGSGPGSDSRRPADDNVGLGLSLAHGLTAAMAGALSVGATSSAGTSMVLRLPRPAPGAWA
jgi:signal transduction histidine kinase